MRITGAPPSSIPPVLNRTKGKATLLVDPDLSLLEARKLVLSTANYSVRIASAPRDVFQLQPEEDPQIVVLSDTLGSFQLQAVAEYVRHRWPRARILILGNAVPALEDALYDDSVEARFDAADFLAVVRRCS